MFRPPPVDLKASDVYERRKRPDHDVHLAFEPCVLLPVFRKLNTTDLANCAVACKAWNKIAQDPSLWTSVRYKRFFLEKDNNPESRCSMLNAWSFLIGLEIPIANWFILF